MERDAVSCFDFTLNAVMQFSSDGIQYSDAIDTADYSGVMLNFATSEYESGSFSISIEHSEDGGILDPYSTVQDESIIGELPVLQSAYYIEDDLPKFGVFSVKRFIRVVCSGTGIPEGGGSSIVIFTSKCREIS